MCIKREKIDVKGLRESLGKNNEGFKYFCKNDL